jgi:hypothetical protein
MLHAMKGAKGAERGAEGNVQIEATAVDSRPGRNDAAKVFHPQKSARAEAEGAEEEVINGRKQ